MVRRKDNRGRVLKEGESQRKNLTYMYRYTDVDGVRKSVYAKNLDTLREKEKEIQKYLDSGVSYAQGDITVYELVERYMSQKKNVRYNTQLRYTTVKNLLRQTDFACMPIRNVKVTTAKAFFIQLNEAGKGYSTINSLKSVLKPAFQMAYEEDSVMKNPFDFKLDMISNNSRKRQALTVDEEKSYLEFIRNDRYYSFYYDEIVVLLGTGLRVSEFCGLTLSALDFENRKITVGKQLAKRRDGTYYVSEPKTKAGYRVVGMSDAVYISLKNIISERKQKMKVEKMVDGYTGFLLYDRRGNLKVSAHIENVMTRINKRYNECHDKKLYVTPHVLRHTFCTRMAELGMAPKTLQRIMGHATIEVTMNVYTHKDSDAAVAEMNRIFSIC